MGKKRVAALNIRPNSSIKKGFGGARQCLVRMQKFKMKKMLGVGGNVFDKEGFGIGKFVVAEEGWEEGEEKTSVGIGGEVGSVGESVFVEREESVGTTREGFGGED